MTDEVFKIIEDHPTYLVSNIGRVLNIKRGRFLSPCIDTSGYSYVGLHNDKMVKNERLHRLVAVAFLANEGGLPQVNHKDEDKSNNSVSNLEWCTAQYNTAYTHAKPFRVMSPLGIVIEMTNLNMFCRDNGLDQAAMHRVISGKQGTHKGWRRC